MNCDPDGKCSCKENVSGDKCDVCSVGYDYDGFPVCDKCAPNIIGQNCDKCVEGYHGYPECEPGK